MPYWRLSSFYFVYFATLGVILPYWSPYLAYVGFSAAEIGKLMAITMATKMIAPNIWGWFADHTGKTMPLVRLAALLSVIGYGGVFVSSSFWWLAMVIALFTFFWHAVLPQIEVITLNYLGEESNRYGRVRLWGSLGFIAASLMLGQALDDYPASLVLPVLLILLAGIFLTTLSIRETQSSHAAEPQGILRYIAGQPEVMAFLLVCFLLQASHAPYYTFYTLYLADFGYSKSTIGMLWAFGVISEVVLFLAMHRFLKLTHFRTLLIMSCLLTAVRWAMIGSFPQSLALLVVAQTLHAVSFGLFHGVAVAMVHRYFTGAHQHRGMALYGSVSFGAGGAVGSLASGYMMAGLGPGWTFASASMVVFLGAVIAFTSVHGRFRPANG